MKVLGIIHSPNYADSTVKKHYQVTKFFGDTFEKTEKSDNTAFKANPKPIINSLQEGAQKVLNNPELIQKSFPAFLAAAFAAMIDLANGKETNTDDNAAQIAAKEFIKSEIEKTSEITEQTKDEISAKRYIELPRRHGTLSIQENYLRETAAKISDISEESERNLQEIWQRLISKGYESDEQRKAASKEELILRKKQSNTLSENIANELSQNIGDTQKIEDIISNYYDKVFANKETLPSKELETPAIETDSSIQDEVEELVAANLK